MAKPTERELYNKAVETLYNLGVRRTGVHITNSQTALKRTLRRDLAKYDIDSVTKAILSTDENWSLTATILAQTDGIIDEKLISPTGDILVELNDRAYRAGTEYAVRNAAGQVSKKFIHKGIDATTLRMIRQASLSQIIGVGEDQKQYLRDILTKATIENQTLFQTMDAVIRDGKVPAFYDRAGKLWEMETRVENIVRTESSRIAEQGSEDKSKEIFGDEMDGKWRGINDGNMRESHFLRLNAVRTYKEWKTEAFTDGKIILPGREPRCRCGMEWREKGGFGDEPYIKPTAPPKPKKIEEPKPPKKPPSKKPKEPKAEVKKAGKIDDINTDQDAERYLQDKGILTGNYAVDFTDKKALQASVRGFEDASKHCKVKITKVGETHDSSALGWAYPLDGNIELNPYLLSKPKSSFYEAHLAALQSKKTAIIDFTDRIKTLKAKIPLAEADPIKYDLKFLKKLIRDYEKAIKKNGNWRRWTIGYDTKDIPKAYYTSIHEYGHQVHNRLMFRFEHMGEVSDDLLRSRRAVWEEWTKRYKKIRIKERWKVSEYSAKNSKEGFAECWTAFVTGEKNVDGQLWELFKEILPRALELIGE